MSWRRLLLGVLLAPATALPADEPSGTAPFEVIGQVIIVKVTLNDRGPFRFVLDTGATDTVLVPKAAEKLGLASRPVGFAGRRRGSVGSVQLGAAVATNLPVFIYDPPQALPLRIDHGLDYHGLLGHNFLSKFVLTLDYRQRKIEFGPPGKTDARAAKVPFELRDRGITVPVVVNGQPAAPALVDTGAAQVVVLPRTAARWGLRGKSDPQWPGVAFATAGTVVVGTVELRNVPVIIHEPPRETRQAPEYQVILGTTFLSSFRVTINYPERNLVFAR